MSKSKLKKYSSIAAGVAVGFVGIGLGSYAYGAATAVHVDMVDNLSATVKSLINGPAAYVIDGIIIGGAGYGAALMRNPAPLVFGLISCGLFHVAVKLLG